MFLVLAAMSVLTVIQLMSLSWKQSRAWHDSVNLWSYALEHGGAQSGEVYSGLGLALQEAGRYDEAIRRYRESSGLARFLPDTHSNLGLILSEQGQDFEALSQFREAVRLKPKSSPMQTNLAAFLAKLGRLDEAAMHYAEATKLDPEDSDSWNNWGLVLSAQGRLVEASARVTRALELRPDSFELRTNLEFCWHAAVSSSKPSRSLPVLSDYPRRRAKLTGGWVLFYRDSASSARPKPS